MEVYTENSESETLCAMASKDAAFGRPILYYLYRLIPKQTEKEYYGPYEGSAILKLEHNNNDSLKGNYFTSVHRKGYFDITRRTQSA